MKILQIGKNQRFLRARKILRILQIGKFYWPERGGIENHLKILCEGLAKNGVSVRAVVSNTTRYISREKINGVEVVRLPSYATVLNQPIFVGQGKEISDFRPDIIHIHLPNPLATIKILGTKIPVVSTYHSDIIGKPAIPTASQEIFTKRILKKSAAVIATSGNYASGSKLLGLVREKIKIIPLSVELDKIKAFGSAEIKTFKKLLGLKNEFVILFAGRLIPYKGLQFLLKALPALKGSFKLIIVGSGPLEKELRWLAKNLGVSEKIIFFGEADDESMPKLYSACDIFALPSHMRSEAFGIVQMEAMAYGKPVVSCNISGSGVPWVNKNGVSGIVVEPENSAALAGATQKLMDSPKLRKELGAGGRKRVEKLFDSREMVSEIIKLYKEVLEKSR